MMRMLPARDHSDPELRRLISRGRRTAVIPIGSMEQHGSHLPISTDADIVTEIAKRVCERKKFLLMPTVSYGVSFEHAPFFNLSLKRGTVRKVLADIVASLAANKIRTAFIINGHHGNQDSLRGLEKMAPGIRVFVLSYWHFMAADFDHAGVVETSLMLAISKNVRMDRAKKGFVEQLMSRAQKERLAKKASKSFISVAKNGVWGDPRGASARKGGALLAEIVRNMEKKCQTCLTG